MLRSMMIATLVLTAPIAAQAPVATQAADDPQAAIAAAMADSAAGWNTGDLARFVAVYADDATYVTTKGLVTGKPAIADRYRPSFAKGGNTRGTLSFRMLGHRTISNVHQLLFARWTLTPADNGKVDQGMTTLLFERRKTGWKIIADHSS